MGALFIDTAGNGMSNLTTDGGGALGASASKETQGEIYDERDRLVILTPCYGGLVTTFFRDSLFTVQTVAPCANFRCADGKVRQLPIVAMAINHPGDSHIDRARNNILHDFEQTHYRFGCFIDGDQPFEPQDIALTWFRLISGVRVLGGSVALKTIKATFACNTIGNTRTVDPQTKLLPGRDTGTGWMAFNRNVLDEIRARWPGHCRGEVAKALGVAPDAEQVGAVLLAMAKLGYSADISYKANAKTTNAGRTISAFFASGVTMRDGGGDWLSEDWMFCHRCIQLGIEIKIDPMIRIKHLGPYLFPPPPDDLVGATLQATGGANPPFNPRLAKEANEALQRLYDDTVDRSISILHATRGRPEKAAAVRAAWLSKATAPVEYIFAIDSDDAASIAALSKYAHVIVPPSGGIVGPINAAAEKASGRILIMAADDCLPPDGWVASVLEAFDGQLHEPRVLMTSDGYSQQWLIPHPIMTREFYRQQGYFFCPEYPHLFCDTELTMRAWDARQIINAKHIVLAHEHPMFTGTTPDVLHMERNSKAAWEAGKAIFNRRNPNHAQP